MVKRKIKSRSPFRSIGFYLGIVFGFLWGVKLEFVASTYFWLRENITDSIFRGLASMNLGLHIIISLLFFSLIGWLIHISLTRRKNVKTKLPTNLCKGGFKQKDAFTCVKK